MKKIICCLTALLLASQTARSQDDGADRPIRKGQNSINVYYGATVKSQVYKKVFDKFSNVSSSFMGPVGLSYEHMLNNVVGLGFEFSYLQFSGIAKSVDLSPGASRDILYDISWSLTTIRAMARANLHFVENGNFDCYGFLSVGLKQTKWKFNTDNPYYRDGLSFSFNLFPFGVKPGLGFRYFMLDNFGLMTEIALGTPIICGGISVKF